MRSARYLLVDVFTGEPFGGNQLAVFVDGEEVPESLMQRIARELNLSETTYVLPPEDPANLCRLRIFTPLEELPMAGHPTVGSAFALAIEGRIAPPTTIVFEEGVGPVPVEVEGEADRPSGAVMVQPLPEFGPRFPDPAAIAAMLTLDRADLDPDLPLEVVSCGVPYLIVPLAGLAAVERARLRPDLWEELLSGFASQHAYLFSRETVGEDGTVHARMFAPAAGVPEDPATGSAAGPLGSYLVRHGLVEAGERVPIVCEQGYEMGRPSRIEVEISGDRERIREVRVGGGCVLVGEGRMRLPG
ncbi:MAG: PhzF family phenazine biosynthesis protein [Thermoanaerobaculia bacterium]